MAEGLAILGWTELGALTECQSREQLRDFVREAYPDESERVIANWTGQIWRVIGQAEEGDLVVMPLKTRNGTIAIGQIAGPYRYRAAAPEGFRHVRPVKWLNTSVSKSLIKSDLLHSLGSLLTVCALTRYDAPRRIRELAESQIDPGRPPSGLETDDLDTVDALLDHAVEVAERDSVRLTVRELIERWDFTRRTAQTVEQISADLADRGLTTRPSFTSVSLDSEVALVPAKTEPTSDAAVGADEPEDEADVIRAADALRVGQLQAGNSGVVGVRLGDSLQLATTLMLKFNYSQLAVFDDHGNLYGAVSWESISKAQLSRSRVDLADVTVSARVVEHDEHLLNQIEEICSRGFVFVRGVDRRSISGIITASDLTEKFGNMTRPFALLEEIELRLRRRVQSRLPFEDVRGATRQPNRVKSVDDLSLGNYKHILKDEDTFKLLGWRLDYGIFIEQLDRVTKIRNEVMHFSPDPVTSDQLEVVLAFANMIRAVDVS
ncbi:hypothetical protein RMN56_29180 [Micromonospora halotolerans]|uniref:CBS domain-containing protein n=1 Tax=Micromonospora halotolerans TaxID=709879 RepID=A0ABY9ZW65_9ACTN|nr:hypothetical protein [Micromonospora halotolerans]WNM39147.1 hypothetical protein RMN56_29180 [Micromonospora halotolerans]